MGAVGKAILGIVALLVVVALVLPFTVKTYQGEVSGNALTFNTWKENSAEGGQENLAFGYVKTYTNVYQTRGTNTGKLYVVGVNTLITLSAEDVEQRLIDTVETKAGEAGVTLKGDPSKSTLTLDDGSVATRYDWTGTVTSTKFFTSINTDVSIVAAVWNSDGATLLCAGYAASGEKTSLIDLIKSVTASQV